MADVTEQLTGLFAPIVTAGAAVKITQSVFGSTQQTRRRKGKARKSSGGSPWSGNPMGGSKPW